jgi:hypothetical protein
MSQSEILLFLGAIGYSIGFGVSWHYRHYGLAAIGVLGVAVNVLLMWVVR